MGSALQEPAGLDCVRNSWQAVGAVVCSRPRTSSAILFRSLTRTSSGGQTCPVTSITLAGRVRVVLSTWLAEGLGRKTRARVAMTVMYNIFAICFIHCASVLSRSAGYFCCKAQGRSSDSAIQYQCCTLSLYTKQIDPAWNGC